jgi:hypothetical protein
MLYSIVKGVEVEEIGLVPHPTVKGSHASPDGTVGSDGLIEIKCPLPAQHLDTLLNGAISNDHIVQMMWQIACCGRQYCDYISFSSDFPPSMQLFVKRVPRDTRLIQELEGEVRKFLAELEAKVDALERRYGIREAA